MEKQSKFRHELKFIISNQQRITIENSLLGLMQKDKHLRGDSYNIRSIYFDDYYNTCYYENENGVDPREKFRIRIYDGNSDFIRLELKRKEKSMTQKFQCELSLGQYKKIMAGELLDCFNQLPPLLKKFEIVRQTKLLKPDVIVDYDRVPYTFALGNVRITFDVNVSSSRDFGGFFDKIYAKKPILQQDMLVLEVKYDEFLPKHIENVIKSVTGNRTSFSKFYLCKKFSTLGDTFCL